MIQDRVRTSAPSHWLIFRKVAPGVTQYMLPLYCHPAQALAAVAALQQSTPRQYHIEECPHTNCHPERGHDLNSPLRRPGGHGEW
jgi:hypothetical protein